MKNSVAAMLAVLFLSLLAENLRIRPQPTRPGSILVPRYTRCLMSILSATWK